MELTLEQLNLGLPTRIKNKEFKSAQDYTTPFFDRMADLTDNFLIQAKPADQISLNIDGTTNFENIVYNRVWVQGVLPDSPYDNHSTAISMLYALDTRKPVVKIFKTLINHACLNMCVFQPEALYVQELEEDVDWTGLDMIIHKKVTIAETLTKYSNTFVKRNQLQNLMGHWIDKCINNKLVSTSGNVKLNEAMPIDVYKDLVIDENSDYYTTDDDISYFTIHNAFTDLITNDKGKDLVNKYEKVTLLSKILDI